MSAPTPPDWVLNTPSTQAMHNRPAPADQWQQPTADQQRAQWETLLESIWQQWTLLAQGVLLPGPAGQQIIDFINSFINDITTLINSIVNFLGGTTGSWTSGAVGQPLLDTAAVLASLSAKVAALQQSTSGQSAVVDFSTYPDSTNLPSIFTQTYEVGAGNPYGVSDGLVLLGAGTFGASSTSGLYNVFVTNGDDQEISAVWLGRPGSDVFGSRGVCILNGRVDASDVDKTFVEFKSDSVSLGCWVGATKTIFFTLGNGGTGFFSFKTSAIYTLDLVGTTYTVTENGAPLFTPYTDSGLVASKGASYRGAGLGARWPNSVGNITPGELLYWSIADQ